MKFLSKHPWWYLILLVGLGVCAWVMLWTRLALWGVSLYTPYVYITSSQKNQLVARSGDTTIIVKRIFSPDNQKTVTTKVQNLLDLYMPVTSPYPDRVTNLTGCAPEFLPQPIPGVNGKAYSLSANERMAFGVCSDDLIVYKAAYGVFDCGMRGVFEVAVYGKDPKVTEVIRQFSCTLW